MSCMNVQSSFDTEVPRLHKNLLFHTARGDINTDLFSEPYGIFYTIEIDPE